MISYIMTLRHILYAVSILFGCTLHKRVTLESMLLTVFLLLPTSIGLKSQASAILSTHHLRAHQCKELAMKL